MAEAAEKLISELQGDRLTSHQLYTLGKVLYNVPQESALAETCQKLLSIIPAGLWEDLWEDLDEALMNIPWSEVDSIIPALQSILALNMVIKSPPRKAPTAGLIHHMISNFSNNDTEVNDLSLKYIRLYLLREREIESFLPILHQLQEDQRLWSKLVQLFSTSSPSDSSWRDTILSNFPSDQKDYLSTLLKNHGEDATAAQSSSIKTAIESVKASTQQPPTKQRTAIATPEQELTRRIEQVKMIVPNYGDGFIEAALSQFQGNVETTVARLLDDDDTWPTVLQTLDRRLPQRAQRKFDQDDSEIREIVKARIKEAAAKEEQEALQLQVAMRHDEYEDDYDDQYDDIDGAGNVDIQDDYEAVRTYNRVLRGIEAEQTFFDDIRNTNRDGQQAAQGKAKKAEDSDDDANGNVEQEQNGERKYRGPDKGRGGRTPGRGRGGRSGQRNAAVENEGATATSKTSEKAASGPKAKPNLKSKARKLDKRRDQQKNAQVKRAG